MTEIWAHCPYCQKPYPTAGGLADHIEDEHRSPASSMAQAISTPPETP